jgi:hypothetical protein
VVKAARGVVGKAGAGAAKAGAAKGAARAGAARRVAIEVKVSTILLNTHLQVFTGLYRFCIYQNP